MTEPTAASESREGTQGQGKSVGNTCGQQPEGTPTYGFWLIWGLNLFAFKFFPVNIPEERMLFDVSLAFRPTAQTFARVLGHQLREKEKGWISDLWGAA